MRKQLGSVKGLNQLIALTKKTKGLIMVEIGCYAGESTSIFASAKHIKMVHAVDPWKNGYDKNDGASHKRPMEAVETIFDERMNSLCQGKYKKYKMTGDEAVSLFEDESLDMVYLDGNHQYEAVKNDIQKWLPKIKKTGCITGHDWARGSVQMAVTEELGNPHRTFCDGSWLFRVLDIKDKK